MRHPFRTLIASSSSRALGALATPALIAFSSLIAGCSDDPAEPPPPPAGTIQLKDANNFSFDSELHIQSIEVAAETDISLKWDGIKKDIQCHDVVPSEDIDTVLFLRFKSTSKDEVAELIDSGSPGSTDLRSPAPFKLEPGSTQTTAKLSDFDANSTFFDPEEHFKEEENVNLLIFQNGTSLGQGGRAMVFVDPGTTNETTIDMADYSNEDCSLLDFAANLHELEQVPVPKAGPWKFDWKGMTTNGQGLPLAKAQIDRMLIGFYAGLDVADLEAQFLDLEQIPDASWELKLDAIAKADLSAAKNRDDGTQFSGFDQGEGTWIMGLFCDACSNPAPFVVTILKPE